MASSTPNHLSIVVNGRVIRDLELREYAERHGLCHICGLNQTHRKVGNFLVSRMEPITTTTEGIVTVYKGYCIQPTCYTSVDQVKVILGETASRPRPGPYPSQGSDAAAEPKPMNDRGRRQPDSGGQRPEARIFSRSISPPLPRQREHLREILFDASAKFPNSSQQLSHSSHQVSHSSGFLAPPFYETSRSANALYAPPADPLGSSQQREISFDHPSAEISYSSRELSGSSWRFVAPLAPDLSFSGSPQDPAEPSAADAEGNDSSSQKRGAFDHLMNPEGLTTAPPAPQPSIHEYSSPILKHLDSLISDKDYIRFLNALETQANEPDLAEEGFAMFTSHVISDQLAMPTSVILGGDGWVKTIKDKMERFKKDRSVVRRGLMTLLSISTLSGNYKKFMVKKGTAELAEIIDRYDSDQEIRELVCAYIYSLCVNEKEGLNAKSASIFKVIRKLAEVVATNTFGQEYALRALFHLSLQKRKSSGTTKMLHHDISNIISGEKTIRAMLDIIQTDGVPETVLEAVMSLLCRVSLPKRKGEGELVAIVFPTEFIGVVIAVMNQYESKMLSGACCGFLSNLAMIQFPREWAQPSAEAICELLSKALIQLDEGITVCGSQTLCNLLSDPPLRALIMSNPRAVPVVLECMTRFPECAEVNELCCLSIAHACLDDQSAKAAVVAAGGLENVCAAFHQFVMGVSDKPSMDVKYAVLCGMASLSGCQEGARKITQTGLIEDLDAILAVEIESDIVALLQLIVKNLRTGATNNRPSGFSDILRQQPGQLPHLLRNADSQQAASILQALLNLLTDSDIPNAVKLAPFADGGFDAMLDTLNLYSGSSPIQEGGCGILAQVYYRVPLTSLDAPARLPSGSWALIHTKNAIDTIQNAMRGNRGNVVLQEYACCALSNFLTPLCCEREQSSSDKQVVSHWVGSSLKDVLDAMAVNQNEVQVHISAIHLFWILSFICNPDDLKRWTLRVLQQIFDSMRQFPLNRDFNVTACDTLMALQNDAESLEFIGSATGINALMDTIGPEKEEVVVTSSTRILASLLDKVYTASVYIMHNSEAIKKLILCMAANQGNHYIQINICSILESIISMEDDRIRGSIGDYGGVKAICDALILHGSNEVLVKQACGVLSSIVPACENILYKTTVQLDKTLIQTLQLHMENPEVQSTVMDVLSTCCRQDEYFKTIAVSDRNCIGSIIQSMNLHLGSAELQKSGCSLIWVISGFANSKETIGLQGGISAIVNGMLAHSDSTAIQKAGSAALKNLATLPCNKPLIAFVSGEDAVLYALLIHVRDPQVVSGALSALNNIAVDSETGNVSPMKEAVLQVVVIAMKLFSDVEVVQKNACFLLKSCSYSDFNLKLMTRSSEKLIPLLFHAAESFSQACGDRAMSVMSKMEKYKMEKYTPPDNF